MEDLHVTSTVGLIPYSLFLLGLGFGPIMAGPLSETFGRKPVYLTFFPIFGLFILGSGLSRNIVALSVCQFFSGVFGSPGYGNAPGSIADIWPMEDRPIPLAIYTGTVLGSAALG